MSRASSSSSGPLDHGSAGTPELFVYGTLTLDAVVTTLVDRVPEAEDATAPGWRAATLPDRPYPGLVRDADAEVVGRVYRDLSAEEWAVLDAFEDPTYVVAPVDLRSGRRCLAYVWPAEALDGTWAASALDGDSLRAYLDRCSAWRSRYENPSRGA